MALALYALVKADQMAHFEDEFKAISKGELDGTPLSIHGQRRHQAWRQISPRVLND